MKSQHIYKAIPQSGFNFELLSNIKLNKNDLIKEIKKIISNHYLKENCAEDIKHGSEDVLRIYNKAKSPFGKIL
ncbi:5383_t:CDS:1, partial [Dentiscutata erythropus]